jgi:hypothetical protein
MRKILIWTSFCSIIGVIIGLKGMSIHLGRVIGFGLGGAILGFCIGFLFFKQKLKKDNPK